MCTILSNHLDTPVDQVPMHATGRLLEGRFRIEKPLALSAEGVLYVVIDDFLGLRRVAKTLRPEIARNPSYRERFRAEFHYASRVRHGHVVRHHHLGEHDGKLFMILDYYPGLDLEEHVDQRPLAPEHLARVGQQLCAALTAIHQAGLVHCDVKPANVLLNRHGFAYLTDFGLARELGLIPGPRAPIFGSPFFMSPEQVRGEQLDARTDLFSLGMSLLQAAGGDGPEADMDVPGLLARRSQGQVHSASASNAPLSRSMRQVLDRCLQPEKANRFSSATDLAAALADAHQSQLPIKRSWKRRRQPNNS